MQKQLSQRRKERKEEGKRGKERKGNEDERPTGASGSRATADPTLVIVQLAVVDTIAAKTVEPVAATGPTEIKGEGRSPRKAVAANAAILRRVLAGGADGAIDKRECDAAIYVITSNKRERERTMRKKGEK